MVSLGWIVAIALLGGCRGGESPGLTDTASHDTSDAGPTWNPGTGDTTNPSTTQGGKVLAEVRFEARIAWDAAAGRVIDPSSGAGPSRYDVLLTTTGGTTCTVAIDLVGLAKTPDNSWLWGLDIPRTGRTGTEDCLQAGVDPAQFDPRDPVQDWVDHGFELRLGGDLSPSLETWLTPDPAPAGFDIAHYIGGDWSTADGELAGDPDINYWRGYAMTAGAVDTNQPLTRAQMDSGSGLATGWYVFDQTAFWTL